MAEEPGEQRGAPLYTLQPTCKEGDAAVSGAALRIWTSVTWANICVLVKRDAGVSYHGGSFYKPRLHGPSASTTDLGRQRREASVRVN